MIPVNFLGVLVCAAASVGIGYIWYGRLFAHAWLKAIHASNDQVSAPPVRPLQWTLFIQSIGAFLMIFTLDHNLIFGSAYLNMYGIQGGLQAGAWSWLGFVAPVITAAVLYEKRSWMYWAIHAGYYLVILLLSGVVLSLWV